MHTFRVSALVVASPHQVWTVLADVVHWPTWLPTVTAVEALGPARLAVGSRYRILQPKLRQAVWSVVEIEPATRFSWESRAPGVRTLASHTLSRDAGGLTRITLEITFSGLFSGLAAFLAGRLTREYLEREAEAIKRQVESGAGE